MDDWRAKFIKFFRGNEGYVRIRDRRIDLGPSILEKLQKIELNLVFSSQVKDLGKSISSSSVPGYTVVQPNSDLKSHFIAGFCPFFLIRIASPNKSKGPPERRRPHRNSVRRTASGGKGPPAPAAMFSRTTPVVDYGSFGLSPTIVGSYGMIKHISAAGRGQHHQRQQQQQNNLF